MTAAASDLQLMQQAAEHALARGDWAELGRQGAAMLARAPTSAEAHFLAGVAALEQRRIREALVALQRASSLAPQRADCLAQLARALSMVRRSDDARACAERAAALQPDDAATLDTLGVVFSRLNDHARAVQLFRDAAAKRPDCAGYQFNLAASLKFLGDFDAAERAYEACAATDPHYWRVHSTLSQLRRQTRDRNHLERLLRLLPEAEGDPDALLHVHMALAKEYEDLEDYPAAFRHLAAGKAARRRSLPYRIADDEAVFDAVQRLFAEPLGNSDGHPSAAPIFVFGMPRSGTTLVERILTAHPQVHSAGELQEFGLAVKQAARTRGPHVLDVETLERAAAADSHALGADYLRRAQAFVGDAARFVDKMPLNFFYAGLIARALPRARLICLRRSPLDTSLSNFRQLFALNASYYHYAYDLLDTGRYYVRFDGLMAHWRRVLPGRILEVQYEDLVADQEGRTRRLLEHCGLEWDDACLHFERNAAAVATASAVQVRQPIYDSSVGRWRHYALQLEPLRHLLQEAGVRPD